jgi:hypothetical protein
MRPPRAILVAAVLSAACRAHAGEVRLACHTDRIDVTVDGEPFTSYVWVGHRKPILFPVLGPGGAAMTRSWPIVPDAAGEAHDHPHHESVWFAHGIVNGVDFWTSHPRAMRPEQRAGGRIEQVCLARAERDAIETRSRWVGPDGSVVCSDTRRLTFAGDAASRSIDCAITIHADHGPVTFGDTKEGSMGLRLPTPLQLRDADGSRGAAGRCLNSAGDRGADVWGKRARWVAFWGPVAGRTVGVSMLDHPGNLRHPTHWHAREYGLVAANPFGVHDFTGAAPGTGDHTIPAGGTLALRYLLVFHEGDPQTAGIDDVWRRWTAGEAPAPGECGP